MKWIVAIQAEGDREIGLDEVVELADAVALHGGVASGMGTMSYGAQLVVDATTGEEAAEQALQLFEAAVTRAKLPVWPVTTIDTVGEESEMEWYDEIPDGRGLEGDG